MEITKFLTRIISSLRTDCVVVEVRPLGGGDIHEVYKVACEDEDYVIKVNHSVMPADVFRLEAEGLRSLRNTGFLVVPEVVGAVVDGETTALVLEYIRPGKGNIEGFGIRLAEHHRQRQNKFGGEKDNYIGRLPQKNSTCETWEEFFSECRIHPLVKGLRDEGTLSGSESRVFDELVHRTSVIVPEEAPALLHGDLWSGNVVAGTDEHYVIDPAVYAGHREMDLAMMKLFGGFPEVVFERYHETYPLEQSWQSRVGFHQIYPLLVHARLFGGLYVRQSLEMARRYL